MPGVPRWQIQDAAFVTLTNGNEAAYRIVIGPFGELDLAILVRWVWDTDFTPIRSANIASDEFGLIQQIMTSANLWNAGPSPTWADIAAGANYVSPLDGNSYSGTYGVNRKFGDWVIQHTTAVCEEATDTAWLHGSLLPFIQSQLDAAFTGLVTPAAPPAPLPPAQQYPPQKVGTIGSAMGLAVAQATRFMGTANGDRPVAGVIPVPT